MRWLFLAVLFFCGNALKADLPLAAAGAPVQVSSEAQTLQAYYAALDQGDIAAATDYLDISFTSDASVPGVKQGREKLKDFLRALRTAFPDSHFQVLQMISQGDTVAVRYLFSGTQRGKFYGIRATHKKVKVTGIDIWQFDGGKLAEQHGNFDALGMFVQLGIAPELK